ncbi:MAG TPA: hypothetical protein VFO96_05980 [Gemmatimonadales bacterium]|nr:hypothetical protein [Gemmatimonadales bacterium]
MKPRPASFAFQQATPTLNKSTYAAGAEPPWRRYAVLALVWAVSLAYVWALLDRGWVPHDEGALADSAIRVLQGQLPHRDFDEIYSGGLSYLNALAFGVWGERLVSMRYMAYVAFACWVPIVFYLASRLTTALAAGMVTLVAVAWSYPNYTAAMPSWYNLYLATASIAALYRYVETNRTRWVAAAGLLAGLSCLIKIIGLYLVAGTLFFFVLYEQSLTRKSAGGVGLGWYGAAIVGGCVAFVAGLIAVIGVKLGWPEFVQFVLPGGAVAGCVILRELRMRHPNPRDRLQRIGPLLAAYGAGLLVPVALFLAFFAVHGAAGDLISGVLVKPFRRLVFASKGPPPLGAMLPAVALACVLAGAHGLSRRGGRMAAVALGAVFTCLLAAGHVRGVGELGFLSLDQGLPIAVILTLVLAYRSELPRRAAAMLWVLTPVLAVSTLVQFPLSNPTYYTFIAPIEVLAIAAAISLRPVGREITWVVLAFYLAYPVAWMTPELLRDRHSAGLTHEAEIAPLLPGRADLRIGETRDEYENLVRLIRAHARGRFIYATADCPEFYFLSGYRNPTRTLFDFFDDPRGRTARILKALDGDGVTVVVINSLPYFSGPVPEPLAVALARKFPADSTIGHFTVRWR